MDVGADFVLVTPPVLDREQHDQPRDEQREEGGDRQHEEVNAVDLRRLG